VWSKKDLIEKRAQFWVLMAAVRGLVPLQLGPGRPLVARHYPRADTDRELLNTAHDRIIAAADHLVSARALMAGNDLAAGLAALIPA